MTALLDPSRGRTVIYGTTLYQDQIDALNEIARRTKVPASRFVRTAIDRELALVRREIAAGEVLTFPTPPEIR